jgi:hypothetical protein
LKKQVITVVLNTNHDVRYLPLDATHCYSQSHSTRIAEVDNAGDADEREMQPGDDHGFLWRLNSYWRIRGMRGYLTHAERAGGSGMAGESDRADAAEGVAGKFAADAARGPD